MMLSISSSGGIGGFGVAKSAEVSVDALPEPLRSETCARLDAAALASLDVTPTRGAADFVVYHIVVSVEGGAPRRFDLPETAMPAETLDLIDTLLSRP